MHAQEEVDPIAKYSTLVKLIRIVATCIRFMHLCRKKRDSERSSPLSSNELEYARKGLIKSLQRLVFSNEFDNLHNGRAASKKSSLKDLNSFIDENDILRVGGRLKHSNLPHDTKHPILLPHQSKFTKLVIKHEHEKNLHAGVEITLAAVRMLYWPIKARGTVRRILRQCIVCFKSRPLVFEQLMGDLPIHRVNLQRPFASTSIDFCPIYLCDGHRRNSRRIKVYVSVFVCMATKAVHLEVVSDLSEVFLNSFKQFIGCRGKPVDMFSDNGINFVRANHELEDLKNLWYQEEHQTKIIDTAASDDIKWHFIPPRAPHFGGLWKAAVKSFKRHF